MNLWQIRQIPKTLRNLFRLTLLAYFGLIFAWSAGFGISGVHGQSDSKSESTKSSASDVAAATEFMKKVHESLYGRTSIKAEIEQTVTIGNQQFLASGRYLSSGPKLRLEYIIKPDQGVNGALIEVCDGKELWSLIRILDKKRVTHRDVQQIKAKIVEVRPVADSVLSGELGLGGLPGLVASLERTMTFEAMKPETSDSGTTMIVQGRWKPEVQAHWPRGKDDSLPAYIPDLVRITVDQQTMFPIKIVYVKKLMEKDKKVYRPMVSLKFRDVEFDKPIEDQEFTFEPPEGVVPEDITRQYLDRIKATTDAAAAASGPATPPPTK